jgi:acyl-CoA synthetase (AMP-forming)/AMP-acid ligase II
LCTHGLGRSYAAAPPAPRSCEFVDDLPMSPAGKPLKGELRKPYWEDLNRQIH